MPRLYALAFGLVLLFSCRASAEDTTEQRTRALLGLTTQLREAQTQEAALNAQTVQLQHYRANAMALASKLSQRQDIWPVANLGVEDLQARALARFVEQDLAHNIDTTLDQLAPLDALRIRVFTLNDAVESLRSALMMEGVVSATNDAGSGDIDLQALPLPEGVYAERPNDFRVFPSHQVARDSRPLLMPLRAYQVRFGFGEEDPADLAGVYAKGAQLLSRPGSTVYAPFEGKIVYAAPYRSFGNLVVIEHEGQGATLLAGLHSFAISVGVWVRQGAPLGLMAAQAASKSSQAPRLYFEFRVNQESVDPLALVGSITNE